MASNINAIEGFGLSPGLQDLLQRQEQHLNLFQQENERYNASLRREIDIIKQRLNNLETQPPNPTSMLSSSNSYRESDQLESMNRDIINSTAAKYPSETADAANGETEACGPDNSAHELLNEQHFALKMEYEMLKYETGNPNWSMARNTGDLTRIQVAKCELERQVADLRRELQVSRDATQTLQVKNEQLELKEDGLNNSENQMSNLETTYAALQGQYNEMSRNNLSLERQIRDLREELREGRGGAEGAAMDRTLERSRQEAGRMEAALRQREELLQRNEQTIAALQQDKQSFQRELVRLENEKDEIMKKNEDKEEMLQALLDDKQYFSAKLEAQERTISELRSLAEAGDGAQKRCHTLEIEISELELNCQTKCSEYTLVIEQRNKLLTHCDMRNKEMQDLRMGVQTYENAIKERDDKLRIAKEIEQEFQTKIDTHSVTHHYLQDELNHREIECQDRKAELQKARADLELKDKEICDLRKIIEAKKNLENPVLNPYMLPFGHSGASTYLPPASSGYYNSPES